MIVNGGFVYVCVKYVEDALKEAIQKKHSKHYRQIEILNLKKGKNSCKQQE